MADAEGLTNDDLERADRAVPSDTRGHRRSILILASLDLLSWALGIVAVVNVFDRSEDTREATYGIILVCLLQPIVGYATGLYRDRFRRFSFDEAGAVVVTAGIVGTILLVIEGFFVREERGTTILIMGVTIATVLMFGHRYVRRLVATQRRRRAIRNRTALVVYGAGEGGQRALDATLRAPNAPYRVAAFVDDDPLKRRLRLSGVKVEGTGADLGKVARRHQASAVLLALPTADGERLQEIHAEVSKLGLETLVQPPLQQFVGGPSMQEFTRYRDEEILRRKIVEIDDDAVRSLVQGTSVLVTGAGGSIGSEIVRQLVNFEPRQITALDHDDSLLHDVIRSVGERGKSLCRSALGDVRDPERLDEIFAEAAPTVVFHAAALKHVPALELAPAEGWKTNVVGTANVLDACERHGVETVVNISTDKAADPGNVLGFTKRIAERMTARAAARTDRLYVSVRFGNVIGSRGSVIETFQAQIAEGGPVTVTHPDVTRYFMAIREAVLLTMQAAALGHPGETLVLDMGSPVRVADIARQLVESSETPVEIVFTGLRPGEKLHEVLVGLEERAGRPDHPMVDHVHVPALDLSFATERCIDSGLEPTTPDGLRHIAYLPERSSLDPTDGAWRAPTKSPT